MVNNYIKTIILLYGGLCNTSISVAVDHDEKPSQEAVHEEQSSDSFYVRHTKKLIGITATVGLVGFLIRHHLYDMPLLNNRPHMQNSENEEIGFLADWQTCRDQAMLLYRMPDQAGPNYINHVMRSREDSTKWATFIRGYKINGGMVYYYTPAFFVGNSFIHAFSDNIHFANTHQWTAQTLFERLIGTMGGSDAHYFKTKIVAEADHIIISTGYNGELVFDDDGNALALPFLGKQISKLIVKTDEAAREYNKLVGEGKKVLLFYYQGTPPAIKKE